MGIQTPNIQAKCDRCGLKMDCETPTKDEAHDNLKKWGWAYLIWAVKSCQANLWLCEGCKYKHLDFMKYEQAKPEGKTAD